MRKHEFLQSEVPSGARHMRKHQQHILGRKTVVSAAILGYANQNTIKAPLQLSQLENK